jgi:hypothetical protein
MNPSQGGQVSSHPMIACRKKEPLPGAWHSARQGGSEAVPNKKSISVEDRPSTDGPVR